MEEFINVLNNFDNTSVIGFGEVASVICATIFMSAYLYTAYIIFQHRSFYNKAFHTGITILPFFIATIILSLQSNLVITLGTIGALAIIRFRTAVKDPVDMIFILWAVHIGICCGCLLYKVAIYTSIVVTLFLFVIRQINIKITPYTCVINCNSACGETIIQKIKNITKKCRVKSRNYSQDGLNIVIECFIDDVKVLNDSLLSSEDIKRFSIIEYDCEDIV